MLLSMCEGFEDEGITGQCFLCRRIDEIQPDGLPSDPSREAEDDHRVARCGDHDFARCLARRTPSGVLKRDTLCVRVGLGAC